MNADEPTHFNTIVIGTGLIESILSAGLSKSGYSVLQLDENDYYGSEFASLSLIELIEFTKSESTKKVNKNNKNNKDIECSIPTSELIQLSQRFSLSLFSIILQSEGNGINLLIKSKVANYLQFGLLNGTGIWNEKTKSIERVPGNKSDVFTHPNLSLLEKRRLTKLLLLASGEDDLSTDERISSDPDLTFIDLLEKSFSLSTLTSQSLAYALALCSSSTDPALPSLSRLRKFLRSIGRYGPSPFLVGHYGGAGDLVGGFSRICAVWGGGQILGRPILPLIPNAVPGRAVNATTVSEVSKSALGIPVLLEPSPAEATVFTADWIISSSLHLSTLFPTSYSTESSESISLPSSVQGIIILPFAIEFPSSPLAPSSTSASAENDVKREEENLPDSNLFVFPPGIFQDCLGTVTAFQVGNGTNSCPVDYYVLYLSSPLLSATDSTASILLKPYLDSLLGIHTDDSSTKVPSFTFFRTIYSSSVSSSIPYPENFVEVPTVKSRHSTEGITTGLEEAAEVAEELFWRIVGEEERSKGEIDFFKREEKEGEED